MLPEVISGLNKHYFRITNFNRASRKVTLIPNNHGEKQIILFCAIVSLRCAQTDLFCGLQVHAFRLTGNNFLLEFEIVEKQSCGSFSKVTSPFFFFRAAASPLTNTDRLAFVDSNVAPTVSLEAWVAPSDSSVGIK